MYSLILLSGQICDKLKIPVAEELKEVFVTQQFQHAVSSGLYPYQVEGVDWLSKGDHRLLADDMGLGKTIQTLMALPEGSAVLVISPASVKYNWKQEAEKWRPEFLFSPMHRLFKD